MRSKDLNSGSIKCFALKGANVFTGTSEGVFLSIDNGILWTEADSGITTHNVMSLAFLDSNLFAGTYGNGAFLSTNNGTSWTGVNSGLITPSHGAVVYAFASLDTDLFVATSRVFRSTNFGGTWTETDSGIYTSDGVYSLAVSGTNLIAGAYPSTVASHGGIYRTTNNGASWAAVDSGLWIYNVGVFTLITSSTNLYAGTDLGVFLSSNNGTSWAQANKGLTSKVYSLAIIGNNIFAGSDSGVYLSTNNGASWTAVNTGLTNMGIFALQVCGGYLLAGTDTEGVWRRPLSEMVTAVHLTSTELPGTFTLMQNYPNPFNPTTIIKYQLPTDGFVTLEVFDLLGRTIKRLVSERENAGLHSVTLNAGGFASGVYFYRLTAESFVASKKLTVIK